MPRARRIPATPAPAPAAEPGTVAALHLTVDPTDPVGAPEEEAPGADQATETPADDGEPAAQANPVVEPAPEVTPDPPDAEATALKEAAAARAANPGDPHAGERVAIGSESISYGDAEYNVDPATGVITGRR